MKLEIEVSEQDLLEFGREAVENEMQASLKRMGCERYLLGYLKKFEKFGMKKTIGKK